jgi:FAD/FMN-containing dehydrogenase
VTQCKFAVRGGGHSDVPGASNIQGGITIDLRALRSINVSSDRKVVSVGAGAKWGEVYTALDARGLKVIGGRAASVGVSGLLLGGTLPKEGRQ